MPFKNGQFGKQLQDLIAKNFVLASSSNYPRCLSGMTTRMKRHQYVDDKPCSVRSLQASATSPIISSDNIIRSHQEDIEIPNVSFVEYIFSRMDSHKQDAIALVSNKSICVLYNYELHEILIHVIIYVLSVRVTYVGCQILHPTISSNILINLLI